MIITFNTETGFLEVTSTEINQFITDIDDYTGLTLQGTISCGSTLYETTYNTTNILLDTSSFYIEDNILYIKPVFFSVSAFTDNIYKLTVKLVKSDSWVIFENCIFIDTTFSCKVSKYLKDLIEENKQYSKLEKKSTIIHLLHYSLVNASNCGCNCTELCEIFKELKNLLEASNPQTTNCGC